MSARRTGFQLALLGGEALIFLASGIVLYVVISRVGGSVLLGQYTLVLSWMLVFQSLGSFGIPELLMRELGRFADERAEYLGAGVIIGTVASLGVMPIMLLASRLAEYDHALENALAISVLSLPGAMILNVSRSGFIACQRIEFVFVTRLFEFLAVLPLNLILLLRGNGIEVLTAVLVGGRAASSLLALFLLQRHAIRVMWWPGRARLRALLSPAATFAAGNSLGIVGTQLNVIMLSLMAPVAAVGHFGAGFKLIESMTLATVLFGQFYMPKIALSLSTRQPLGLLPFRTPFRFLFAITMPVGIGLVLFPEFVVNLVFGADFAEMVTVLRIMGVFYIVYGIDALLSMILKAGSLQRLDLGILSVNPVINVLVNLALIPNFGAVGAAIGQLSGGFCSAALRYCSVVRRIGSPGWISLAAPLLAFSVVVGSGVTLWDGPIPEWAQASLYGLAMLGMIGWAARARLTRDTAYTVIDNSAHANNCEEASESGLSSGEQTR